jgi:hypothetical protein
VPHRVPLRFAKLAQLEQFGRADGAQHRGVHRLVRAVRGDGGQFGEQCTELTGALLGGCAGRVAEAAVALVVTEVGRLDRVAVEGRRYCAGGYLLDLRRWALRGQLVSTLVT